MLVVGTSYQKPPCIEHRRRLLACESSFCNYKGSDHVPKVCSTTEGGDSATSRSLTRQHRASTAYNLDTYVFVVYILIHYTQERGKVGHVGWLHTRYCICCEKRANRWFILLRHPRARKTDSLWGGYIRWRSELTGGCVSVAARDGGVTS